jgi:putative restriction endonuclease
VSVTIGKAVVANTARAWFDHFRPASDDSRREDEVNFWRPASQNRFRAVEPGAPFFFRIGYPTGAIVGAGSFAVETPMSVSMAWEIFGEKNGDLTRERFFERIRLMRGRLRGGAALDIVGDEQVSCLVVREALFLPERLWVPWSRAEDWSPRIQSYKIYELATVAGRKLADLLALAGVRDVPDLAPAFSPVALDQRTIMEQAVVQREGQGTFRSRLLVA